MKPRSFGSIILLVVIAGGFTWWLFRSPAIPEKGVAAPVVAVAKPPPAPPVPSAPRVEPSVIKPVPASAASSIVDSGIADSANPQGDLNKVIPDMARLFRAGDLATLAQIYVAPDELAKRPPQGMAELVQMSQRPEIKQMLASMGQVLEALRDQTPSYNVNNDEATYQLALPPEIGGPASQPLPLTFIKINGLWYVKHNTAGPNLF